MSGGILTFTAEVRNGPDHWTGVATVDHVRLCARDYERFLLCADTITAGDGGAAVLGLPLRGSTASLGPAHCDCCQAELADQATTLEFVPLAQVYAGRSRTRFDGALRRLRLCKLCLAWWRTTIAHPLTLGGLSSRRHEGPEGGWLNHDHGDAVTLALRPRDVAIVAITMRADGTSHRPASQDNVLLPGEMLFVGAGKARRATRVVQGLDPAVRHRVAVVALLDQLDDAGTALLAGASELLATPLSPQQVVAAFARADAPRRYDKDPRSGLPILSPDRASLQGSCLEFSVSAKSTQELLELALLARRALRGYDAVGTDGKGNLSLHVFAEPEYRQRIGERLALTFGKGYQVTPVMPHASKAA